MRLFLVAAIALLNLLVVAAVASAAPTPNFAIKHGETNNRTGPTFSSGGVRECLAAACSYETHDFTIAPDQQNTSFKVSVNWAGIPQTAGTDAQDDWDLYVYRVLDDGTEVQVGSSAAGATTAETATVQGLLSDPVRPGKYRIYMDNFKVAPQNQEWRGFVAFEPYVPTNVKPIATLTGPADATTGQFVTLDASGSSDPDGTIENYAFDLNGDGKFDIDGASPRIEHKYRAGRTHVSVRVRDDRGGVGYATHTITVAAPAPEDRIVVLPPPPGSITISMKPRQKLGAVAVRGVAATLTCPTSCGIVGRLSISRATARRLGLGRRGMTIARRTRSLSGERSTPRVRLKPARRTLNALRRARLPVAATVRITVTAEGYSPKSFTRRVSIVR